MGWEGYIHQGDKKFMESADTCLLSGGIGFEPRPIN